MDPFEKYIASADIEVVSPDEVTRMGKKAAARYVSDGVSLSASIAEFAKEASLNDEQIKRTVEAANNETFSLLFKQPFEGNISFDMAEYGHVQKKLGRKEIEKTAAPLNVSKVNRYIPGMETVRLSDAFKVPEEFEKSASEEEDVRRLVKAKSYDFMETRELRKKAESDLDYAVSDLAMALRNLSDEAKTVVRNGEDMYKTAALINAASPDGETSEYLLSCLELPVVELNKTASIAPNKAHPLYLAATNASTALEKTASLAGLHGELLEKEETLKSELREL